jgi:hypothetical protein
LGLKATLSIGLVPGRVAVIFPLAVSQSLASPLASPTARVWPFGLKATL